MEILKVFAALGAGYLLGSLNTAILVGQLFGTDITRRGSNSAGLTNTLRILGKPAAAMVLAGDILKGVLACLIGLQFGVYVEAQGTRESVTLLAAGAGAVLGHNWPIYFGFRGGKGALTAAAVMFVFNWVMALTSLGVFVAVIALTRYVSLGTICATLFFVAISFLPVFGTTIYFKVFVALLASIIVIKHQENIRRLAAGTENKLSLKSAGR